MGVHGTSQASGYGLTQRMIAGLSLGAALAAVPLYYETRRKHHQAHTHAVTNPSRYTVGPLIDEPPPSNRTTTVFLVSIN